jgi:hypothetical protein
MKIYHLATLLQVAQNCQRKWTQNVRRDSALWQTGPRFYCKQTIRWNLSMNSRFALSNAFQLVG